MLSLDQRKELERLQAGCLKTTNGYDLSYSKVLEESSLSTLKERQQECFDELAIKLANNPECDI